MFSKLKIFGKNIKRRWTMAKNSYPVVKVKLSSLSSKEEEKKKQKPMYNAGRR
jgi:hypothetical protein